MTKKQAIAMSLIGGLEVMKNDLSLFKRHMSKIERIYNALLKANVLEEEITYNILKEMSSIMTNGDFSNQDKLLRVYNEAKSKIKSKILVAELKRIKKGKPPIDIDKFKKSIPQDILNMLNELKIGEKIDLSLFDGRVSFIDKLEVNKYLFKTKASNKLFEVLL